jgi:hypothetical protein
MLPFLRSPGTPPQTCMGGTPRVLKLLLFDGARTTAFVRPQSCCGVLLSYPRFILKPEIHLIQRDMPRDRKARFNWQFF